MSVLEYMTVINFVTCKYEEGLAFSNMHVSEPYYFTIPYVHLTKVLIGGVGRLAIKNPLADIITQGTHSRTFVT